MTALEIRRKYEVRLSKKQKHDLNDLLRKDMRNQGKVEAEQGFAGTGFPNVLRYTEALLEEAFEAGREEGHSE